MNSVRVIKNKYLYVYNNYRSKEDFTFKTPQSLEWKVDSPCVGRGTCHGLCNDHELFTYVFFSYLFMCFHKV